MSPDKERERVQEILGQAVLDAIRDFAHRDIESVAALETSMFGHVTSPKLRNAVATTLFGTRWLYKISLGTRASREERLAVLRMQIIDYAAITEALLKDSIADGVAAAVLTGSSYKFRDFKKMKNPIAWGTEPLRTVGRLSLAWLVHVAGEEKIISPTLHKSLDDLRTARNSVHISTTIRYTPDMAKDARDTMRKTATATKRWKTRKLA